MHEAVFILITRPEDFEMAREMRWSFRSSTQDLADILQINGSTNSLSISLNEGIKLACSTGYKYVGWVHPDMSFISNSWLSKLIDELEKNPEVVKVCADNARDGTAETRTGNQQCWLMRCNDFNLYPQLFFSEEFKGIGGYEDWYQMFCMKQLGKLCLVRGDSIIWHRGAQTRKLRNTNEDAIYNGNIYGKLTGLGGPVW